MPKHNIKSFKQNYSDNYLKVYRLAQSLCGNEYDAMDITHEAFLKAFRSYHSFRKESSFFTWIYRITINTAKDYMKNRNKPPFDSLIEDFGYSIEDIIDPNPANNPETELFSCQVRVLCLHCLTECLPMQQRTVFCLSIILDLPHKLIAEILNCSINSVKITLHRSKIRWFGYMKNRCQFIKKSNPCNCKQYVRFGQKQGWFSKENAYIPHPQITRQAKEDVTQLKILQNLYHNIYKKNSEVQFAQRLKRGINDKEWVLFSNFL